jgi:hypothetical protein
MRRNRNVNIVINCLCTNKFPSYKLDPILKNTYNSVNLYLKLTLFTSDVARFVTVLALYCVEFMACGC